MIEQDSKYFKKEVKVKLEFFERKREHFELLSLFRVTYSYENKTSIDTKNFEYNIKIEKITTITNNPKIKPEDLYILLPLAYNEEIISKFNISQIKIIGEMILEFLVLRKIIFKKNSPLINGKMVGNPYYWEIYFRKQMEKSSQLNKEILMKTKKYEERIKKNE